MSGQEPVSRTGGESSERITVGFYPRNAADLRTLAERSGMTKADIVNRAVALYAYVEGRTAAGDDLLIRDAATGDVERIRLL